LETSDIFKSEINNAAYVDTAATIGGFGSIVGSRASPEALYFSARLVYYCKKIETDKTFPASWYCMVYYFDDSSYPAR
jgi:hypothetical protein